jgi:hypothetical protein
MMTIPSAGGAALLLPEHMVRIVRYAGLFQQRQELLFERHFLEVFALIANVGGDLVELRNTYAERPIAVLPLESKTMFLQESRGVCFEVRGEVLCGITRIVPHLRRSESR